MSQPLILALDQGTTSSRAMAFNVDGQIAAAASQEFTQHFPADGWVEHDPEDIWDTTLLVTRRVLDEVGSTDAVAGIAITNQRETTLVWDRQTGKCIYPAIVWQDRRTADTCAQLKKDGCEPLVAARTGLLLDPYFSASKLAWILDNVERARPAAEQGKLAFGTVDTYLLWRLTGGRIHRTDATNASRTMLMDLTTCQWDHELCELFRIPTSLLPEICDCVCPFGNTDLSVLDVKLPVRALIGDQQAALVGQACLEPGMTKSTYGTGCFVVANAGDQMVASQNRLLATVGYRLNGQTTYAVEGSIFNAGSAVQWLRDSLRIIEHAADSEAIAAALPDNRGVYLVPAFTGLGAPYWDAEARGGLFGMTRDTGPAEIVRATLESVAYQTCDLLTAMRDDGAPVNSLRVDGGMTANRWLMQFLADIIDMPVHCASVSESTAWGAAALAALDAGLIESPTAFASSWTSAATFQPQLPATRRSELLDQWQVAVQRVRTAAT